MKQSFLHLYTDHLRQFTEFIQERGGKTYKEPKHQKLSLQLRERIGSWMKTLQIDGDQMTSLVVDLYKAVIEFDQEFECFRGGCFRKNTNYEEDVLLLRKLKMEVEENDKLFEYRERHSGSVGRELEDPLSTVEKTPKVAVEEVVEKEKEKGGEKETKKRTRGDERVQKDIEALFSPDVCARIAAKVSLELFKHYRRAEKFGKSVTNLHETINFMLTVGEVEDSFLLLADGTDLLSSKSQEINRMDPQDTPISSFTLAKGAFLKG